MGRAHDVATQEASRSGPPAASTTTALPPDRSAELLRLQRTAGNRAVGRAVAQPPARRLAREPPPLEKHAGSSYNPVSGTPFVTGAGDTADVDANDVKQGGLGDCGLLAPLAAVARANPAKIRSMISARPDGSHDVTLHYKDWPWSSRTAHTINVTSRLYTNASGTPLYAGYGDLGPAGPELWVALIEKAFAKSVGGYAGAWGGLGSEGGSGLELVTGNDATSAGVRDGTEDAVLTAISGALAAGDAVVASTSTNRWQRWTTTDAEQQEIDTLRLVRNHLYAVESVDTAAKTLNLRNPWGKNHLHGLSVAAFRRHFYTWARASAR